MTTWQDRSARADTPRGRHPGWPARLGPLPTAAGQVALRPLRRRDGAPWAAIRIADEALIARWDATSTLTWAGRHGPDMWRAQRALLARSARCGDALPFAVTVDDRFAGQVTVGGIQRAALRSCWIGYWIDSSVGRKGVATAALALTIAHVFGPVGLHRVEATIAPENAASRAVVDHLGLRLEGRLERYLDISGAWRDHLLYAMTVEECQPGPASAQQLLARRDARG